MAVRFYLDADLLGVAKILAAVRSDVTYPGDAGDRRSDGFERPPCPIQPGDKDVDWIPQVAAADWIIVSRDRHIQYRLAERVALVDAQRTHGPPGRPSRSQQMAAAQDHRDTVAAVRRDARDPGTVAVHGHAGDNGKEIGSGTSIP